MYKTLNHTKFWQVGIFSNYSVLTTLKVFQLKYFRLRSHGVYDPIPQQFNMKPVFQLGCLLQSRLSRTGSGKISAIMDFPSFSIVMTFLAMAFWPFSDDVFCLKFWRPLLVIITIIHLCTVVLHNFSDNRAIIAYCDLYWLYGIG